MIFLLYNVGITLFLPIKLILFLGKPIAFLNEIH